MNNLDNKMTIVTDLIRKDYIKAEIGDRLSKVIGKLKHEAFAEVLVFKGDRLEGIFSPVFATKTKHDIINAKVDKLIRSATTVEKDTAIDEIIRKMIESDYNALPVKSNGEVVGIIHIFDLICHVQDEFRKLKIKDIGIQKAFTIKENEGISKAINILHDKSVRALVVLDEKEKPTGVITHFDIMRNVHLYSHERDHGQKHGTASKAFKGESDHMDSLSVYNFIRSKEEISVISSDPVSLAIDKMIKNKILNLLVKDTSSIIRAKNILRYYNEGVQGKG